MPAAASTLYMFSGNRIYVFICAVLPPFFFFFFFRCCYTHMQLVTGVSFALAAKKINVFTFLLQHTHTRAWEMRAKKNIYKNGIYFVDRIKAVCWKWNPHSAPATWREPKTRQICFFFLFSSTIINFGIINNGLRFEFLTRQSIRRWRADHVSALARSVVHFLFTPFLVLFYFFPLSFSFGSEFGSFSVIYYYHKSYI